MNVRGKKIKSISKSLSIVGIYSLLILWFNSYSYAMNATYEGKEIRIDRPEGELRYFKAEIDYQRFDRRLDADKNFIYVYYDERNSTATRPMVFTSDGKVYVRNLTGYTELTYIPIWAEGKWDDESIVFDQDAVTGFNYMNKAMVSWGLDDPLSYLQIGNKISYDGTSELIKDETQKNVVLKKNERGDYEMDFPENMGFIVDTQIFLRLITGYRLTPIELSCPEPPSGYEPEDYQITFAEYGQTIINSGNYRTTLRIKIVRTESDIYIQGLSMICTGDPAIWIKGEIKGDKVIFKNGGFIGVGRNCGTMFLTPMTVNNDAPAD